MKSALSVNFGIPEHGWLPVKIISDDYEFSMDASDVPVNPLELLCDAILDLQQNDGSEVWWHLEPASVFFEFTQQGENYQLAILTADRHESQRKSEKTFKGSFQEIVEPFIIAVTVFYSRTYDDKHWPMVDSRKVNSLRILSVDRST